MHFFDHLRIFDRSELKVSVIVLGIVLSSLPILLYSYFPSQDGPSHLLNSKILVEYARSTNSTYADHYQLNLGVFPNWFFYAFFYILDPFFDYGTIEGIFLVLYLSLFTLGFVYFIRNTKNNNAFLIPIGLLLAYNYFLMMGFYNYCMGLVFFLLGFSFWWKHKEDLDFQKLVLLNILLFALYFSHVIPWLMIFYAMAVYYVVKRQFCAGLKTFAALSPTVFLFLIYMSEYGGDRIEFASIPALVRNIVFIRFLVSFGYFDAVIGLILFLIVSLLIFLTVKQCSTRIRDSQVLASSRNAGERLYFAILTIATTCVYLVSPAAVGRGSQINVRILFFVILFLLPCIHIEIESIKEKVAYLLVTLFIARLFSIWFSFDFLNRELALLTAGAGQVEYGKKSLSINRGALIKEHSFYYQPFAHVDNLYHLEKGLISPDNYEANKNYFPVIFRKDSVLTKPSQRKPLCSQMETLLFYDYLFYYLRPDDDIAHCLLGNFEMIFRNEKVAVFEKSVGG